MAPYLKRMPLASQGLDFVCRLFTQPGDTVFVENPTYSLALRIFADHRLNVVGLPMDEDGLITEALEERLTRERPVFFLYHSNLSQSF